MSIRYNKTLDRFQDSSGRFVSRSRALRSSVARTQYVKAHTVGRIKKEVANYVQKSKPVVKIKPAKKVRSKVSKKPTTTKKPVKKPTRIPAKSAKKLPPKKTRPAVSKKSKRTKRLPSKPAKKVSSKPAGKRVVTVKRRPSKTTKRVSAKKVTGKRVHRKLAPGKKPGQITPTKVVKRVAKFQGKRAVTKKKPKPVKLPHAYQVYDYGGKPVRNQFTVIDFQEYKLEEQARILHAQLKQGFNRFRFYYMVPPELWSRYREGVGSTYPLDKSVLGNTYDSVLSFLKGREGRIKGTVVQYWLMKQPVKRKKG